MTILKKRNSLNLIFLKLVILVSLPVFSYGNKSKLENYHFFNAFATENLLVFKNDKDYEEWKKRASDKKLIIKLYKQKKICEIPKNSYVTLLRSSDDFRSFHISIFEKEEACKGTVNEWYIHDKLRDMLKIEKKNKIKNWENYYNSLNVFEISKYLATLFSEKVPIKLDEETTLVSAYSKNEKVYFNKEFLLKDKYIHYVKDIQKFITKDDTRSICNNLVGKIFLNKEGKGIYNWAFYNGDKKIHSFSHTVIKKDCGVL